MQISTERLEDNKVKINVTVDSSDVSKQVKETYKEFAKKYKFHGFRQGKAPRPVIDSTFGKEGILADATNSLLKELESKVFNEADITSLKEPEYDDVDILEDGKDYEYSIIADVIPEVELDNYDPVEIYLPDSSVSDEEVDNSIEMFRSYYAQIKDADEGYAAKKNDMVEITVTGEEDSAYDLTDTLYEIGSHRFPGNFDKELLGVKTGDSLSIELDTQAPTSLEDVDEEQDAQDKDAEKSFIALQVKVGVVKVKELPELDDDFAQTAYGLDNIDEMRKSVTKDLKTRKEARIPAIKEQRAMQKLGFRIDEDYEVPELYLEAVTNDLGQQFMTDLANQGVNLDQYLAQMQLTPQAFMSDLRSQAQDVARESLALDALARHLGIEVTEEDIAEQFESSGVQDPEARRLEFEKNGQLPSLREFARRLKAIEWLTENAKVTETEDGIDPEVEEVIAKRNKKAEEAAKLAEKEAEEKKKDDKSDKTEEDSPQDEKEEEQASEE